MSSKESEKKDSSNNDEYIGYIDKNLGLKYCNESEEIYQEMVKIYCLQGQKNIPKLSEYYELRDWKNYKIIVHAIKSTSLVIGATTFSEKAKRMEQLASENAEESLLVECEKFLEEYKEFLDCIKDRSNEI